MATYLVTGGSGFIGSNLVDELLKQGHTVRVLDNLATGRYQNLAPFINHIDFHEADLRDLAAVQKAVAGADYVLHQAALPSVPRSIKDPLASNEANVTGTLNVLKAAVDNGVKRVVYASSSSAYGDTEVSPKHEALTPAPKSPYAVSKLAGEYYCRVFYQVYGLETVCLRYFNVFGPRQDPKGAYAAVIPLFVSQMRAGQRPTVHGDGLQSRDFTYVANNVQANLKACTAPAAPGNVYNIACGDSFTLLDLVRELNGLLGTSLEPEFLPSRTGDVKHSKADITRARQDLGFDPTIDFKEGLRRLLDTFDQFIY